MFKVSCDFSLFTLFLVIRGFFCLFISLYSVVPLFSSVRFLKLFGKFCSNVQVCLWESLMDSSWIFLFTEKYHYSLWSQDKTLLGRVYFVVSLGHWGPCSHWWYQPSSTSLAKESHSHCSYLVLDTSILSACLGRKRGSWSSFCFTWIPKPIILINFSPAPQICHFDGQRHPGTLHLSQWCPPSCILSFGFLCRLHPAWLPFLRDSLWLLIQQGIILCFLELLWIYLKTCFVWGRRQEQCTQGAVCRLGLGGSWEPFCCPNAESWLGSP